MAHAIPTKVSNLNEIWIESEQTLRLVMCLKVTHLSGTRSSVFGIENE